MPTQTDPQQAGGDSLIGGIWKFSLLYNMQNVKNFGQLHIPWSGLPAAFFPDKEFTFGNKIFSGRIAGPMVGDVAMKTGKGVAPNIIRQPGVTFQFGTKKLAEKYSRIATFDKTKFIPKDTTKFVTTYTKKTVPGLVSKISATRGISLAGRAAGAGILIGRAAGIGFTAFNILFAADIIKGGFQLYGGIANAARRATRMDLGGSFFDTKEAYTSRQRAVQAINASHLQARSAIGNEAQLMHR